MSNSAAQFNLLKFVEHKPQLSANRIVAIIILFIVVIMSYFFFQVNQFRHDAENAEKLEQNMAQMVLALQPLLQKGEGNALKSVLLIDPRMNKKGFYPEFEALSNLQVKDLWLRDVQINRAPSTIKMIGAMDSPAKLDELLKQIALQSVFKNIEFLGVRVNKGMLPDLPEKYQKEAKKLKIPDFYHFIIQTTAIIQQEKKP